MQEVNQQHPALELFDAGYGEDIIPVIPPGAKLSSSTKIRAERCGKIPGKRDVHGEWVGFKDWPTHSTTRQNVEHWISWGASFGLRTRRFPFVDIDVDDATLADEIADAIERKFPGARLRRYGRAPRCAIPFRTDFPFRKVIYRIRDKSGVQRGVVEISGDANQVVVHGLHPKTQSPYEWTDGDRRGGVEILAAHAPQSLPLLSVEAVKGRLRSLLELVAKKHELTICEWQHTDGGDATSVDQRALRAPDIGILAEAVKCIPNDEAFSLRSKYIGMLFAIRAAAGPDQLLEGLEIALEWCARWTGGYNDPEEVRRDYESCNPPALLGWDHLARLASPHGFNSSAFDCEASDSTPPLEQGVDSAESALWVATATEAERIAALHRVADKAFFVAMKDLSGDALWNCWENLRASAERPDPLLTTFQSHVLEAALNLRSFASDPILFDAVLAAKLDTVGALERHSADEVRLLRHAAWVLIAPIAALLGQQSATPGALRQPGKTPHVDREWLVDGWIPRCGVAAVVGAPGGGKSFVMVDLSYHVATQPTADELTGQIVPEQFAGHAVVYGSVVYCGSEDVDGWMQRAERRAGDDSRARHLYVASRVPPLSSPGDALRFVRDVIEQLRASGAPRIGLLIIDVFKAATTGDENSSEAMGLAMGTAHAISRMLNAVVLIVHHTAKNESNGASARGSSAIEAALDFEAVVAKKDERVALMVKKNKNGPSGGAFEWNLQPDGILREGAPRSSTSHPVGRACAEQAGFSIRKIASDRLSVSRRELYADMVAIRPDLFVKEGKADRSRLSRAVKDASTDGSIEPLKNGRFRPGLKASEPFAEPADLHAA